MWMVLFVSRLLDSYDLWFHVTGATNTMFTPIPSPAIHLFIFISPEFGGLAFQACLGIHGTLGFFDLSLCLVFWSCQFDF